MHALVYSYMELKSGHTKSKKGNGCLGGVTDRTLDLRSSGRGFDSRSARYQATKVNSAFHPSRV